MNSNRAPRTVHFESRDGPGDSSCTRTEQAVSSILDSAHVERRMCRRCQTEKSGVVTICVDADRVRSHALRHALILAIRLRTGMGAKTRGVGRAADVRSWLFSLHCRCPCRSRHPIPTCSSAALNIDESQASTPGHLAGGRTESRIEWEARARRATYQHRGLSSNSQTRFSVLGSRISYTHTYHTHTHTRAVYRMQRVRLTACCVWLNGNR